MHEPFLAEVKVFTMVNDERLQEIRILQGPPHHQAVLDTFAIVGESHGARVDKIGHIRKLLSLEAFGDGRDREDIHQGSLFCFGEDIFCDSAVVIHGVCVGHGAKRGEPSFGGSQRGGINILFIFLAGLSEVSVHIDETWRHNEP